MAAAISSRTRSRGSSRSSRLMSDINVVPYIDVMLVLLVIFMVTAPLLPPGTIDLPKVGKSNSQPNAFIEVQISAKGDVLLKAMNMTSNPSSGSGSAISGEAKIEFSELASSIKKLRGATDVPVVISADKSVKYETVMKAMDELQKENISRVGLMVKKQ
jgi:biopolymer transport protein TolR